jgi:uncharacterized protein
MLIRLKHLGMIIFYFIILAVINFALLEPLKKFLKNTGINIYAVYNKDYSAGSMLFFTLNQAFIPAMVIFGAWLCLRIFEKKCLSEIGFHIGRKIGKEFLLGSFIAFTIMSFILTAELFFGWIEISGFSWQYRPFSAIIASLYVYVIQCLCVSLMEEVFIRGYLMYKLEKALGSGASLIITSCVFGLLHLMNPTGREWALFVIPFSLSLAGFLFGVCYLYKRSLWIPIGLHFAWNLFQYNIYGLTNISKESSVFLVTNLTGPEIWVGLPNSSFGPEVGLLGIIGMIIGIAILMFLYRKSAKNLLTSIKGTIPQ